MKTLQTLTASLVFTVALGQPGLASAAAEPAAEPWLVSAFAGDASLEQARPLDEQAMIENRGEMAPLIGVVAGIAGLDLALMGFYWGYYIPTVSSGGGSCSGCNSALISQH